MLKLATDENFNNSILRGLLRRRPDLDIIRVQDAGLSGADDPIVLDWAATEGRVLLTHDAATITKYAFERINAGKKYARSIGSQSQHLCRLCYRRPIAVGNV